MTGKWIPFLTGCFLAAGGLSAGTDGVPGFDYLRWDQGARASSMGGAYTAASHDLTGMFYNPASLSLSDDLSAVFSYHRYYADINSAFAAVARSAGGGKAALSIAYLDYGRMDRTDQFQTDLGTFAPGELLITAAYADSLTIGLVLGAAVKYIHQSYDHYRASALALDMGLVYSIPAQNLTIGVSVRNIGTALSSFIGREEKLPLSLRAGVSKRLAHLPLLLHFDLISWLQEPYAGTRRFYWALGGEFTITDALFLRWGYHSRGAEQSGGENGGGRLAGFSAGLGFTFPRWQLDCGWNFYGVLGNVPSVTFSLPL